MLNRERFAIMKKGVRLLNFARGGLVNNDDLKDALANGTVSSYVTDFPDEELLKLDNVIAIPHLGASTPEAEDNCAIMAVNQIKNFLEYGNIKNSVNFPDCELDIMGATRIIIANKNVPNMVGQITSLLAGEKINIAGMINRPKNDYAYNIINIDDAVSDDLLDKIRGIDGVIMARMLHSNV